MPYPDLLKLTEMATIRRPQAIRAGFAHHVDDAMIDQILDFGNQATSPFSMVAIRELGGAVTRVPVEATAFGHRDKAFYLAVQNAWDDGPEAEPERHVAWTEGLWRALAPRMDGAYANLLGDEGEDRVRAAYPEATFARLAENKRRYDPDNVFRLNANIRPA